MWKQKDSLPQSSNLQCRIQGKLFEKPKKIGSEGIQTASKVLLLHDVITLNFQTSTFCAGFSTIASQLLSPKIYFLFHELSEPFNIGTKG